MRLVLRKLNPLPHFDGRRVDDTLFVSESRSNCILSDNSFT